MDKSGIEFRTLSSLFEISETVSQPGSSPSPNDKFSPAKLDVSRISQARRAFRNVLYGAKAGSEIRLGGKSSKTKGSTLANINSIYKMYEDAPALINFKTIKQMNRDPVIAFNYAVLSSIIRSLPYSITSKDKMQEEFLKYILDRFYDRVVEVLCTGIYNGFSIQQEIWGKKHVSFYENYVDDNGVLQVEKLFDGVIDDIVEIKAIDPGSKNILFYVDMYKETLYSVAQYDTEVKGSYLEIKREQLIHHSTGNPFNRIFGRSRYVNIAAAHEISKIVYKYILKIMDDNSDCPVEVGYPPGSTIDPDTNQLVSNYDLALKLSEDVAQNTEFVIPTEPYPDTNIPKWHVKVKTDWEKKNADSLFKYLHFLNNQKTIGLFMPPQFAPDTDEDSSTSYQAAMELLMFVEEPLVTEFEETIKRDLLDRFLAMNFSLDSIVGYNFNIDKSLFNRRQIMKELVMNLTRINGQHISSGKIPEMTPDLESIFNQLNIPIKPTMEIYRNIMDSSENDSEEDIVANKDNNDKRNKDYRITKRSSRAGQKKTVIPGA